MRSITNILRLSDAAAPSNTDDSDPVTIEANGITVTVRGNTLVDDVSIECRAGNVLGIVGPNGAGKSTLLKVMAGLTKATHGCVSLNGKPVHSMTPSESARLIAYAPQSAAVHPFTAIDMVLMGRYPYLRRFQLEATEDRRAAHNALTLTDTAQFADRRVDTLSGGERQRVMIARVLAQDTDVILADEPIASLDIKHQLLTLKLLRERARNSKVAVCVVMHDLNLAATFCDRLLAMHKGRAVATGKPHDVLTPKLIQRIFQVNATIDANADGAINIRVEAN